MSQRRQLVHPPAPASYLPDAYDRDLLLQFTDFFVRAQQGSGSDSINFIAPGIIDRIRRNITGDPVVVGHYNRGLRMLMNEFPRDSRLWTFVAHPHTPVNAS